MLSDCSMLNGNLCLAARLHLQSLKVWFQYVADGSLGDFFFSTESVKSLKYKDFFILFLHMS